MTRRDSPIRILCVDDHRILLDGLTLLLSREPDMEVVATATTAESGLAEFSRCRPDVTLMDLQLPGINGLEAIRRIRDLSPEARIIVLTMFHGDEDVYRALDAGAATYLLKDTLSDDLINVVREVHAGTATIPASVSSILSARRTQLGLTVRETQVVQLIAQGFRNKEIAFAMGITEETAKVHVKNIRAKLNVNDRAAVIQAAVRRGIIHID